MDDLERILAYIKKSSCAECEKVNYPPFSLFFHAKEADSNQSFAVLDLPLREEIKEKLAQLQTYFEERQRSPCLHYLDTFAPDLEEILQEHGYVENGRSPIFACTPETYKQPDEVVGLEIETVSSESSLAAVKEAWNTNALGFDMNADLVTDEQAEEFQQYLKSCRAFTAHLKGKAVGAGMFDAIQNGVAELSGITTLEPYRRRGIASVLTAYATQVAFSMGVEIAYLVPEPAEAGRVYQRVGYRHLATMLIYHLPLEAEANDGV